MHNETSGVTPGTKASPGDPHGATGADARPFLYVVRGEPTDAELAAVVTVLAARTLPRRPGCRHRRVRFVPPGQIDRD